MKRRDRTAVIEAPEPPPTEPLPDPGQWQVANEKLTAHLREYERLLDAAADRVAASDRLIARITDLHSHDNLTGCCLTCGRAGPCKTTRILTGESA